jgi:hypothetical protein
MKIKSPGKQFCMRAAQLLFVIPAILPLAACSSSGSWSGGVVKGRVLEYRTNKPIPGAIVVVQWEGNASAVVDSQTVCIYVDSTVSDDQGRYKFDAWRKPATFSGVSDIRPEVTAYKAGYGERHRPYVVVEGKTYLVQFIGTHQERLEYLRSFRRMECGAEENDAPKLIPLYKAIYEEARGLAVTKEEQRLLIDVLRNLEDMEYGSAKSDDNWRKRMKELQ